MGNAMLDRLAAQKQEAARIGEQFGEQLAIDLMQIALHRQGWGYDRIRRLLDEMEALSDYYDPAFHRGDEQDVWQERMDAELRDAVKDRAPFYPFSARYPAVAQMRLKVKRGVEAIGWDHA